MSRSGFHAWGGRPPSERARRDAELTDLIKAVHDRSRGTHARPRVHVELAFDHGMACGHRRVARFMRAARLMQAEGVEGVRRRRRRGLTKRDPAAS